MNKTKANDIKKKKQQERKRRQSKRGEGGGGLRERVRDREENTH